MAYVLAVISQFSNGQREIHIKARGRSISTAVDVAEIVRRRFVQDVQVRGINIGTEELNIPEKGKFNVSSISITLGK
jgi:DNA-binding protein